MITLRLIASPSLGHEVHDAFKGLASISLLANVSDAEVNASFFSLRTSLDSLTETTHAIADAIGASSAANRALRLELQSREATSIGDELLRSIAVDVHGALRCPIFVARRSVPTSAWEAARPMGWGNSGLALGSVSPSLPYGGSESLGLAIEVGAPTVVVKVKLTGASLSQADLEEIATAVGGGHMGFVDVGAYPLGSRKDDSSIIVLELGDVARTPVHRVLDVIRIEAQRFGARLGCGALLTEAPLETFTGALGMHMGLPVKKDQVIETHLPQALASG